MRIIILIPIIYTYIKKFISISSISSAHPAPTEAPHTVPHLAHASGISSSANNNGMIISMVIILIVYLYIIIVIIIIIIIISSSSSSSSSSAHSTPTNAPHARPHLADPSGITF